MTVTRFLGCILFTYIALLFATTGWNILLPSFLPMPHVALILLVYFSLKSQTRTISRGSSLNQRLGPAVFVGLGSVLGYLCDLFGFTPLGLQSLLLSLSALFLWLLSTKLLIRGLWFFTGITSVTAVLYYAALYGIRSWMNLQYGHIEWQFVLFGALTTIIFSPIAFALLGRLDSRVTRRAPSLGISLP